MKNVVIVGGGAGGIELATFLGDKLGHILQLHSQLGVMPTKGDI